MYKWFKNILAIIKIKLEKLAEQNTKEYSKCAPGGCMECYRKKNSDKQHS